MDRRGRDTSRRSVAGKPHDQHTLASAPHPPTNVLKPQPPQHLMTMDQTQPRSSHGSNAQDTNRKPIQKRDVDLIKYSGDSPGKAAMLDKTSLPKPTQKPSSSAQAKPTFLVPSASPLAKPSARRRSQSPSKRKGDMNDYLLRTCRHCRRGMSVRVIKEHESECKKA